jgi:hypothetical protein
VVRIHLSGRHYLAIRCRARRARANRPRRRHESDGVAVMTAAATSDRRHSRVGRVVICRNPISARCRVMMGTRSFAVASDKTMGSGRRRRATMSTAFVMNDGDSGVSGRGPGRRGLRARSRLRQRRASLLVRLGGASQIPQGRCRAGRLDPRHARRVHRVVATVDRLMTGFRPRESTPAARVPRCRPTGSSPSGPAVWGPVGSRPAPPRRSAR